MPVAVGVIVITIPPPIAAVVMAMTSRQSSARLMQPLVPRP